MISPIDRISQVVQEENERGLIDLEALRDFLHGMLPGEAPDHA